VHGRKVEGSARRGKACKDAPSRSPTAAGKRPAARSRRAGSPKPPRFTEYLPSVRMVPGAPARGYRPAMTEEPVMPKSILRSAAMCGLLLIGLTASESMAALAEPSGRVLLSVTGKITETNGEGRAEFDRQMLEALGTVRLRTWTPWTDGVVEFEGVPARRILDAVGAAGSVLVAIATNEYSAKIPVERLRKYPVILAMSMNGKQLRLRDKGPLWIVMPWSDYPELDNQESRHWSVWQLRQIEIR
jgi:hypothetical protein